MPPATLTVLVVVLALFILGLVLIANALRRPRAGLVCPAQACGYRNPPGARYCARCGLKLDAGP